MKFTRSQRPPVSLLSRDMPVAPAVLDLNDQAGALVELAQLQVLRSQPYRTGDHKSFGNEPGPRWMPCHLSYNINDGSMEQDQPYLSGTPTPFGSINTYDDIAEVVHNDYKIQMGLRTWRYLMQRVPEASVFANPDEVAFVDADALVMRLMSEAIHEAMVQCFQWKWHHNWERPIPALNRAIDEESQYREVIATLEGDAAWDGELTNGYDNGHPEHPSFPAGHGVCIAATVTVLRAVFDQEAEIVDWPISHELAAVARAAALGRMIAGIHYRVDMESGLGLGEAVARKVLTKYDLDPGTVWFPEHALTPSMDLL